MKSSTAIESLMFLCGIVNLKGQVIPDCDSEFSSQAAGVIRSRIDDPVKMNRIETILSACNKSRMQKLTEISVFLLEKSVFPSRVLDDLHSLEQVLKDERFKRLEIMRQSLPSNLGKTMDEVSNIQTNNSLSGNEKLLSLLNTIAALPREYRRLMEDFLNREATPTQVNLKYDIGGGLYSLHGQSAKVSSDSPMPKNDQNPTPFSMKKDLDQVAESHKNISPNALIRKSDMLSLDESPSPDLFEVPPVIYKYNIPNTQSFDLLTKNPRKSSIRPYYDEPIQSMRTPMDPIVPSNSKSHLTETRSRYTTTASFADKMDDADLLNPRTSVLSDAVHLLESAIPRFKAEMLRNVAPNNARYSAPYTFPIPEYGHHRLSHTSNVVTGHSGRHDLLPYRDDSSSSSIRGVSPPNNEVELPRFHTNIGRFANGVANRVALSQRHPLPMNEMRTDNADNIASSQQNSVAAQNPSHLTYSGCSNGVDPAKYQKLQTKIFPKSSAQLLSRNWSDKISNHQGHNLLDMNHLGSLTIGYFDKEQPYHRTPEANSGTTAVMMAVTSLPEFRPYRSPEEITGSHVAREVYNIRHLGKPRFVKIDLLNE